MKKVFYSLILLSFLFCFACSNMAGKIEPVPKPGQTPEVIVVEVPIIEPPAGDYASSRQTIKMSTKTKGAEIFYTLDGSEPTTSSNRYTEPFNILGSKKIKAIAVYKNQKSRTITSKYNLNAGKNENQLGVIYGTVTMSDSLSESVKSRVQNDTIYIFSDELPGNVKKTKIGEEFYFDGLDTTKSYSFFFTNKEPGNVPAIRSVIARNAYDDDDDDDDDDIIATVIKNQQPEEGAGLNINATLKATGTISGKALKYNVSGETETDNSGIVVFIPGTSYAAYTDINGNFVISGVPQGQYKIRAQYANYISKEIDSVILKSNNTKNNPSCNIEEPFKLYFSQGIIKGVASLENVSDSENSGININISDRTNTYSYSATTSSGGQWGITDVYPGSYTIEFSKDRYSPIILNGIVVSGAETKVIPSVTLQVIGGALSGSASLRNKSDFSGISIILEKNITSDNFRAKNYYGITDSSGNFIFDNIMPGTYKISASYPGFGTVHMENITVSKGDNISNITMPVMVESKYSVSGKVLLEGIASFEGTNVILKDGNTFKQIDSTVTGKDGIYVFNNIEIGNYIIEASHDGYLSSNGTSISVTTDALTLVDDFVLENALGKINGNVKLESSSDFAGITILLTSKDSEKTYSTVTDIEGYYSFAGIIPGTWTIQATKEGYVTKISEPFSVTPGIISVPNNIELKIGMRSIFGTVSLEGRTDFTGVKITATNLSNPSEIYSALSNKDGLYALTGMKPGEYVLSYAFDNYVTYTGSSIDVVTSTSTQLENIILQKATGTITGIVNMEGCDEHSGILVELVGTDKVYTTLADGVYTFDVPSGNYSGGVRFTKEDYTTTAQAETITVLTDSTYGVPTVEMKAIATTVKGTVDLAGSEDDSGILVTIDGIDSKLCSATTDSLGRWTLYHVPLGYNTIRFSKVNVPDVTNQINIVPGNYMEISKLEMIPDSATLKGYVYLNNMTDSGNIYVTVTTDGRDDIVVKTKSDGTFEVNNILASGNHKVTFSKDGWDSQSFELSDLKPLETRVIGKNREYVLLDTTAPVWSETSILLNNGANFANSYDIKLDLSAIEKGSGIEQMSVQVIRTADGVETNKYPSIYNWQNYKVGSSFDIEALPNSYVGNGTFTFFVTLRDKSGNISSTTSKQIILTNMVTSLSGVLTGTKLHLTKECSPYLVEADCIVSESDTLVIDPGVEVQFAGDYSIAISGTIKARGTESEKVLFTKSESAQFIPDPSGEHWVDGHYEGDVWIDGHYVDSTEGYYWKGISINGGTMSTTDEYNYLDGNIMEYCEFEYADKPLDVKASSYIKNCNFHDNMDSVSLAGKNTIAMSNVFSEGMKSEYINGSENVKITNNIIKKSAILNHYNLIIRNNDFIDSVIEFGIFGAKVKNNNFIKSNINVSCDEDYDIYISNCNFIDCDSPIISTDYLYQSGSCYNIRNNYFDSANTQELEAKGAEANISFIHDYYDDFSLMKFDYSDWATEPFEACGYQEGGIINFDYTINNNSYRYVDTEEIKDKNISIEVENLYSESSIESIKIAQSYNDLKSIDWMPYSSITSFTINMDNVKDGYTTIYVQLKNYEGSISRVVSYKVPFNTIPQVFIDVENGKEYTKNIDNVSINLSYIDNGKIVKTEAFVNNVLYASRDSEYEYVAIEEIDLPLVYMPSGNYELRYEVYDSIGNKGVAKKNIVSNRNIDNTIFPNTTYNSTTGQFLKDNNTAYLWHLDSDGKEVDGDSKLLLNCVNKKGGFNGSADINNSTIPVSIEPNNCTIEFWCKGGDFHISKSDSFYLNESYFDVSFINSFDNSISTEGLSMSLLKDSKWHYYSFVIAKNYIAIYRDGVIVNYKNISKTMNINENKLEIAAYNGSKMDELRISNCVRSADEINTYYKAAKKILDSNSGSIDAIIW